MKKLKELAELYGPRLGVALSAGIICVLFAELMSHAFDWMNNLKSVWGLLAGWQLLPRVYKLLAKKVLKK